MGQKHRDERKKLKAATRAMEAQGWHENEFGELCKSRTKAEARRWLLRARQALDEITKASLEAGARLLEEMQPQMRLDVLQRVGMLANEDVRRAIDEEVFG